MSSDLSSHNVFEARNKDSQRELVPHNQETADEAGLRVTMKDISRDAIS